MKTISFRIKMTDKIQKVISEDFRIYSSIYRFAYNRFRNGLSGKEVYAKVSESFPFVNCHIRNSAQQNANGLFRLTKDKKVYFGQFKRFQKGLITKEEYKNSKNLGLFSEGENNQHGNRLFKLDVQNGKIIYKRACKEHYDLIIDEQLSPKRKKILSTIQSLMNEKKIPISVKVKNDNIYFTYDEKIVEKEKQFKDLKSNRVLGIDLNPNYFGISIIEFKEDDSFKVLYKEVIGLEELQSKPKNKINFEIYEIDHHILNLCKNFKVSKLSVEDLKFKKNKFWNKNLNRLYKNQFRY